MTSKALIFAAAAAALFIQVNRVDSGQIKAYAHLSSDWTKEGL